MYLGIDIGGTFTDLVLMDEDGAIRTAKAPTTPGQLEQGVFEAVRLAAEDRGLTSEGLLKKVKTFGHGTTQATNALIERDGAVTGLITTRGFGDTLLLQRLMGFTAGLSIDQLRWYSRRRSPDPIVPRRFTREVPERIDQAGNVVLALDEIATRQAVQELAELGIQTFAVSLLWSFRNPSHERRIAEIIREVSPGSYLSLSSDVAPVIGEYERTATTTLNSYLSLKVASYLEKVEHLLRARGFTGAFYILNSSGGVVPPAEAARKPVVLVASGPTGGVMGSMQLAHNIGEKNIITTDMGGTSFDVAIIAGGKPVVSGTREVGGYHLATPMIDIRAIGAGGGSIAVVEGGQLRVGPESAGADPGPVCYGKGGKRVTVTDADVVLGIISTEKFLGGRMKLDRDAAVRAVREQIADPLGVSFERAAAGIRSVVDGRMADLLREVTVGRGHDPRDFTLFAYGGAGPVHCSGYGADLGVARILIPATSMAHSAYGALASDIHQTAERSLMLRGGGGSRAPTDDIDVKAVAQIFDELQVQCLDAIERAGIRRQDAEIVRSVDMRYRRQTHDLIVPVPAGPITSETVAACVRLFQETYEAVYGKGAGLPQAGIELSTFRVAATGHVKKPIIRGPAANELPHSTPRQIFEPNKEEFVSASVWDWQSLPVDFRISGPGVIEHPETTVYVAPGQAARMDHLGNIVIELQGY
jgi:N-methylhydantoinase A